VKKWNLAGNTQSNFSGIFTCWQSLKTSVDESIQIKQTKWEDEIEFVRHDPA
jgi:hypothetical protein